MNPPEIPRIAAMSVVGKGPTSMLLSLRPPKYGSARATRGITSEATIVRETKELDISEARPETFVGLPGVVTRGTWCLARYAANETTTARMNTQ